MYLKENFNQLIQKLENLELEKIKILINLTELGYHSYNYPLAEKFINQAKEILSNNLDICLNRLQIITHTNSNEAQKEIEHINFIINEIQNDNQEMLLMQQDQNIINYIKRFYSLQIQFYIYEKQYKKSLQLCEQYFNSYDKDDYLLILYHLNLFQLYGTFQLNIQSLNETTRFQIVNELKKFGIDYRLQETILGNYQSKNMNYYLLKMQILLNSGQFTECLKYIEFIEENIKDKIDQSTFYALMCQKGECLLGLNRYKEGFELFYKYKTNIVNKDLYLDENKKLKIEDNIQNKKILIITDQGFGDNLTFIKYLNIYVENNPQTEFYLMSYPLLIDLLKINIHPNIKQIYDYEKIDFKDIEFDKYIRMSNMPYFSQVENQEFMNYNFEINIKTEDKNKKIFKKNSVGIFWRTNNRGLDMRMRSFELKEFLQLPSIQKLLDDQKNLVSFQVDITEKEKEILKEYNIQDLSSKINSFYDTAFYLYHIDELHSIDTAIVNLSGFMKKKSFCYIKDYVGWRYGENEKSKTFYDMTVYRYGEWLKDNIWWKK